MTTFEDGPAKGQHLRLQCAPRYMRVTQHGAKFDALDQSHDQPLPGETLYAYQIVGTPGVCHMRIKGGGGFYAIATYRIVPDQPPDALMRSNTAWQALCKAMAKSDGIGE